jgi:hypothetical protein
MPTPHKASRIIVCSLSVTSHDCNASRDTFQGMGSHETSCTILLWALLQQLCVVSPV